MTVYLVIEVAVVASVEDDHKVIGIYLSRSSAERAGEAHMKRVENEGNWYLFNIKIEEWRIGDSYTESVQL